MRYIVFVPLPNLPLSWNCCCCCFSPLYFAHIGITHFLFSVSAFFPSFINIILMLLHSATHKHMYINILVILICLLPPIYVPLFFFCLPVNEFIYLICLLSVCLLITVSCSTPFQCVNYYLFNHQSKWLTPIYSLTFFYSIPISLSLFIPLKLRLVACFLRVSFIHYNNHLLGSDPDHSLSTLFLIHSSMHHFSLNRSRVYIFVLPWSLYSLNKQFLI